MPRQAPLEFLKPQKPQILITFMSILVQPASSLQPWLLVVLCAIFVTQLYNCWMLNWSALCDQQPFYVYHLKSTKRDSGEADGVVWIQINSRKASPYLTDVNLPIFWAEGQGEHIFGAPPAALSSISSPLPLSLPVSLTGGVDEIFRGGCQCTMCLH